MKINPDNIILLADSYKYSHGEQYPENMISMFDYIESRGSSRGVVIGYTKFFGLQYFLRHFFSKPVTVEMVEEARAILEAHGVPFDYEGWMIVARDLNGKLPLNIRAVPEGTVVPNHNVLVTVESTDSRVPWIVGWAETALLRAVWYPTTVCTRSHHIKQIITKFMEKSSDNMEAVDFMLHDFGARGITSMESAAIGGMAHLVNFKGTDNITAIIYARNYYHSEMAGFSVPASEHSTVTSLGKGGELEFIKKLLSMYGGKYPIISCVADSYNYYQLVDAIGTIKQEIIDSGSKFVVRPDSGHPVTNVIYAAEHLASSFGYTVNSKGYKVLNNVGILQGDGITEDTIYDILKGLTDLGYSAENVVFGMGGALLQGNDEQSINRDTFKFAMKCSSITLQKDDGTVEHRDVYKSPITDSGKISKRGRLDLIKNAKGEFETVRLDGIYQHPETQLKSVFYNGYAASDVTLDSIREVK